MGAWLLTTVLVIGAAVGVWPWLKRFGAEWDAAERWGIAGLVGMGVLGWLTFFVGLVPNGFRVLGIGMVGLVLVGAGLAVAGRVTWPERRLGEGALLPLLGLSLLGGIGLVGALAPSTAIEWDSLAYHLAVPKLWLAAGEMIWIPAMHQSNFPFLADNWHVIAFSLLGAGDLGEMGAKSFQWWAGIWGAVAVFGVCRRWFGGGGWWGAALVLGCPVILWEMGSAYIDASHGLYAGLGLLFAGEAYVKKDSGRLWLAAVLLGFAVGSKITGLTMLASVGFGLALVGLVQKRFGEALRVGVLVSVVALVIGSPWYVRTWANTGNPVYPFFSSVFPTRDWDAWRAELYSGEQATFGVPGAKGATIGHSVLGLAYQPGRYVNPGQTTGGGFPMGALGAGLLLAAVLAALGRAGDARLRAGLACVGVCLLIWYGLSQQSRYLAMIVAPLAVAGGAVAMSRFRWGVFVMGAQAAYTAWMLFQVQTATELRVVMGQVSRTEYRNALVPFGRAAEQINALPEGTKLALYDEVFGYLLNHSYMWANPGHSTLIPYGEMANGEEWRAGMKTLGFTTAYVNLGVMDPAWRERWLATAGMGSGAALTPDETDGDLNLKWLRLTAEAVRGSAPGGVVQAGGGLLIAL